jgi:hypothetical protein
MFETMLGVSLVQFGVPKMEAKLSPDYFAMSCSSAWKNILKENFLRNSIATCKCHFETTIIKSLPKNGRYLAVTYLSIETSIHLLVILDSILA